MSYVFNTETCLCRQNTLFEVIRANLAPFTRGVCDKFVFSNHLLIDELDMFTIVSGIVLAVCVIAFTVTASAIDYRTHRIPNKLTLPMFAAGWVYQLALNPEGPWYGLKDGLAGFAIGFGMFFLLWILGSGGGGDAKMVGALSVWLGFNKTLALIIVSTILVIVVTGALLLYAALTKGVYRAKRDFIPGSEGRNKKKGNLELLNINRGRAGMTYGMSVSIATVLIIISWPLIQRVDQQRKERESAKIAAQKAAANGDQQDAEPDAPKSTDVKKVRVSETDPAVKNEAPTDAAKVEVDPTEKQPVVGDNSPSETPESKPEPKTEPPKTEPKAEKTD
jgi:prepilin peptidase CpaA